MILKPQDINPTLLKLKKKISVGNNSYNYPIRYETYDSNLVIQTPIVYIPFDISSYNHKTYINISFQNCDNDDEIKTFKDCINNLENVIIKKFKKSNNFVSSIKTSNFYAPRLRLCIENSILVFDSKNEKIKYSEIIAKRYGKFLIQPSTVWFNNNCFGIIWSILQVKLYLKFTLKEYSFIDDNEESDILKYKQMLKVGIPLMAVEQHMKRDGLDPKLLTDLNKNKNKNLNVDFVKKITPGMLTGIKLKKTDKVEEKKLNIATKPKLKIDLNEILSIRNKLKNI